MSAIAPPHPGTHHKPEHNHNARQSTYLGTYTKEGRRREILSTPAAGGSKLVIDRDALTGLDEHLIAHLPSDEPEMNPYVMCALYLEDRQGRHCRRLTTRDRETHQPTVETTPTPSAQGDTQPLLGLLASTLRPSQPQLT
jgi:hypothetical protein